MTVRHTLGSIIIAALAIGCGSGNDDAGSPGPGGGVDGPTATGTVVSASTMTMGGVAGLSGLEGAEVCAEGLASVSCVLSDADGHFSLAGLPTDEKITLHVSADGFVDMLVPATVATEDVELPPVVMANETVAEGFATAGGFTWPMGEWAMVLVTVLDAGDTTQPVADARIVLTPSSGIGPVYSDASGRPDDSLQSTGGSGVAAFGDVSTGIDYELTVLHDSKACHRSAFGWPGQMDDRTRMQVGANQVTGVTFECD